MKQSLLQILQKEPYRIYFPIGIIYLIIGLAIWLPYAYSQESAYPIFFHRYLVLNGFLFSFVSGFLMTALPQFTKSMNASPFDLIGINLLTILGAIGIYEQSLQGANLYLGLVCFFQALLLLLFLLQRFLKAKENAPYTFFLIALGLLIWMTFGIARFLSPEQSTLFSEYELQHEAAINLLLLGVGGRLFPGIMGHKDVIQKQKSFYETRKSLHKTFPLDFIGLSFIFVASYFIPFPFKSYAGIIQLLVIVDFSLRTWKLYKLPTEKSALTWNLWMGLWLFVLGYVVKVFWPESGIHGKHIFFIGSYVLLILVVATRVSRAHGGIEKEEEDSRLLYVIGGLIVLSLATRVSAFLMIDSYATHLSYAAFLLIIALMLWGGKTFRWFLSTPNKN